METKIYVYKNWVNIKPTEAIKTTRRMTSFCFFNSLPDCIIKSQGGWYLLTKDNRLEFVAKTLEEISFKDIYELIKKENDKQY